MYIHCIYLLIKEILQTRQLTPTIAWTFPQHMQCYLILTLHKLSILTSPYPWAMSPVMAAQFHILIRFDLLAVGDGRLGLWVVCANRGTTDENH